MAMNFLTEAFKVLKTGQVSEDALQEAFCKLWAARCEPRSEREARGLLGVTARNVEIDEFRRRRRRREVSADDRLNDIEQDNPASREEMFRKVESLVEEELTPLQKTIIKLHEYEGLTLEEVADELGMQAPAVRMQLSRARKTLRNAYRQEYGQEED